MPGIALKLNPRRKAPKREYSERLLLLLLILLLLVAVSSWLMGYHIGKTVNTTIPYSGQLIDTIVLTPGKETIIQGQGDRVYRINILGRIIYTDGTPFAHGMVELRSTVRYTTTDSLGYFSFEDVEEGQHTINVLQDGMVLTSAVFQVEKSILINQAQVIKLKDGSFSIILPLEIERLELLLELVREGEGYTAVISLNSARHPTDEKGSDAASPKPPPGNSEGPVDEQQPPAESPGDDIAETVPNETSPPVGEEDPGGNPGEDVRPDQDGPRLVVTGENPVPRPWSQTATIDVFAERAGNTGVRSIDGENTIAPGAKGRYVFKLRNPESYPLFAAIRLGETDQNVPTLPMRYRLKSSLTGEDYIGGGDWKRASQIRAESLVLDAGAEAYFILEWQWLSISDEADTALGTQQGNPIYVLDLIINASSGK